MSEGDKHLPYSEYQIWSIIIFWRPKKYQISVEVYLKGFPQTYQLRIFYELSPSGGRGGGSRVVVARGRDIPVCQVDRNPQHWEGYSLHAASSSTPALMYLRCKTGRATYGRPANGRVHNYDKWENHCTIVTCWRMICNPHLWYQTGRNCVPLLCSLTIIPDAILLNSCNVEHKFNIVK